MKSMSLLTTTRFNNHELIGCNRFSDFGKLVRVLSWVLRFVYKSRSSHSKINKVLSAEELKKVRFNLLRCVQIEYFEKEITDLGQGKIVLKYSRIYKLSPFIENDGLLKMH